MSKTAKIIIAITIIGLIVAAVILKWVYHPHPDIKNADAIKVSAVMLYDSFLNDSSTAKKTYTNKIVEVTGEFIKESLDQQNHHVLFLKTNTPDAYINCTMEEYDAGGKPNAQVTVKGICNGINAGDADLGIPGDVILTRCYPAH